MTPDIVWTVILVLLGAAMTLVAALQSERLEAEREAHAGEVIDLKAQLGEMAFRLAEAQGHTPARGAGGKFVKRAD